MQSGTFLIVATFLLVAMFNTLPKRPVPGARRPRLR
jgi:hypothetical protein